MCTRHLILALCLLFVQDTFGRDFRVLQEDGLERRLMMMMKKKKKKMKKMSAGKSEMTAVPSEQSLSPAPTSSPAPTVGKGKGGMKSKGGMMKKSSMMKMGKGSTKTIVTRGTPMAAAAVFEVMNTCVTDGNCIRATDNALYNPRENCEWTISSAATLSVTFFELEEIFDFVFVNDLPGFSGTSGMNADGTMIDGLSVEAGDTITFISDAIGEFAGFEICLV